jgi:hypothetical protein
VLKSLSLKQTTHLIHSRKGLLNWTSPRLIKRGVEILANVNNQRSPEPMEDSVDSVHLVSLPPQLPLLVGTFPLLMLREQHMRECQRGTLMLVWQPMIIKFLASLHMLSKAVIKNYTTIPKMTGLLQPHIMLLRLHTAVILVMDCNLPTSHICNGHSRDAGLTYLIFCSMQACFFFVIRAQGFSCQMR